MSNRSIRYELYFKAQEEVGLPFILINTEFDEEALELSSEVKELEGIAIQPTLLRKVTVEVLKKW